MTNEEIIEKIKDICKYKNNWDSYGATPILTSTINRSIKYIKELSILSSYCKVVVPNASGAIVLEYEMGDKRLTLRFFESENKFALYDKVIRKYTNSGIFVNTQEDLSSVLWDFNNNPIKSLDEI